MRTHIFPTIILGLLIAAPSAFAQVPQNSNPDQQPRVKQTREVKQVTQRMRAGVRSGELTRRELTRVRGQQAAFQQQVNAWRSASSSLTPDRRQSLKIRRLLFSLTHNQARRGGWLLP
jgi:GH15 family glucan-1,4-alpha-glucosidase